jgi:hypothetical protein
VYNPEVDRQVYCSSCSIFFHVEELEHKFDVALENPESRIIRGQGWERGLENALGWSQVGTRGIGTEAGLAKVTPDFEDLDEAMEQISEVLQRIEGVYECKMCYGHL